MAKYHRFEDLPAWQEAARLYNRVLDLLDQSGAVLSPGFRGQLDRAALSVSNNIAEGFERATTAELVSFLAIAKGSAGEVRSMVAVVKMRPKLKALRQGLEEISSLAESCARQVMGWIGSIDGSTMKGKRHLDGGAKEAARTAKAARDFRMQFLRGLKAEHPLYRSEDARVARGESLE